MLKISHVLQGVVSKCRYFQGRFNVLLLWLQPLNLMLKPQEKDVKTPFIRFTIADHALKDVAIKIFRKTIDFTQTYDILKMLLKHNLISLKGGFMSVNRLSLDITDAKKAEVAADTAKLNESTQDFNVVITKEEIKSIPKVADRRIPFVEKSTGYTDSNPEFLPPHYNAVEFKRDFKAYMDLREMVRPLRQILSKMEYSMMVSGSEAYEAALQYYKSVRYHASIGTPGAQAIYDDLRQLFEMKARDPEPDDDE